MKTTSSIISGLAGAAAITLLHEILKRTITNAPRMDKMGRQGVAKIISATGADMPSKDTLQEIALGGDLVSNAGYFAMVGIKPGYSLVTGAALGLAAGIGAVTLPGELGLNEKYSGATNNTKFLTLLLYVTGGLVAGFVHNAFEKNKA